MRQSSHRTRSHQSSSHSRSRIVLGILALSLGSALTCVTQEPNLDYCATVNGDLFCRTRHPQVAPYCVLGSSACVETEASPYAENPNFDGCIATIPDPECHSPCGGEESFYEESSCFQPADSDAEMGNRCTNTDDCGNNELCVDSTCEPLCREWSARKPGYGPCLDELGGIDSELCTGEGVAEESCVHPNPPIDAVVCSTPTCTEVCDCPPPPPSGDAAVTCGQLFGANQCYLECDITTNCPDGMQCLYGACMHPAPDLPIFGNCGVIDADCINSICYKYDNHATCVNWCRDAFDFDALACESSHPNAICGGVDIEGPNECHIPCMTDENCPRGMRCINPVNDGNDEFNTLICMWPPMPPL